jgi:glycosyltransferase involved in cell wall biosynthesis
MKISICMGTKNEEKAIAKVIKDFRKTLKDHKLEFVITDGSTDRTAEIAESMGAKVIKQKPQGYGIALKEALLNATGNVIFTTDCDDTYPVEAVPEMLGLIEQGYDVVSGSRLKGRKRVEAMKPLNEFGNRLFAKMVSVLYNCDCTDASTGMRAFRREVIQSIPWTENIGLSLELFFKPAALGYRITEIPIDYKYRVGDVKLNPWKGGVAMVKSILKYKVRPIRKLEK